MPFQVMDIDFVGPIYYKTKAGKEVEAYLLMF